METTRKLLRGMNKVLGFLGGALVILLILHVSVDVFMRNVFGYPLIGTIEIVSTIYMIGICFLPLALVDERDAHIAVEVLTELMPTRIVDILVIIGTALATVVMAGLAWRTWIEAMAQMEKGAVMITAGKEPMLTWPSYFILPVGFALSVVILGYKLFCLLTRRSPDFEVEDMPAGLELVNAKAADHV